MEPTLNVGDLIIVKGGVKPCDIIGDWPPNGTIIVFHKPGDEKTLIVHRAVKKIREGDTWIFRTKGDRSWYITGEKYSVDPWKVKEEEIVGVVIGRIPLLGYVALFMQTRIGLVILIVLFAFLLFMELIPSRSGSEK